MKKSKSPIFDKILEEFERHKKITKYLKDIGDYQAKAIKEDKLTEEPNIDAIVDWELSDHMQNYWKGD